ncbi:hypothetical protein V8C34DRAFT_178034 [Trichoderma compactum]
MDELQKWTQKAQDHITQVAVKKRAAIIDERGVRINNIETTTKMLPPAPAVEVAIEEGTQAVIQAGEDEITHSAAASPLKRFSMKISMFRLHDILRHQERAITTHLCSTSRTTNREKGLHGALDFLLPSARFTCAAVLGRH